MLLRSAYGNVFFFRRGSGRRFRRHPEIVRPLKAKVGVSAVMLDTGESVSVGDEAFYPMQSVYKFPLALSVLKRVDQEVLNLDQKVHVTRDQLPEKTWSPLRDRFPQGGEFR